MLQDDDGHWYIVPAALESAFEMWVQDSNSTHENFEKYSSGGNPANVTFTNPKWGIDGISLQK